MVFKKFSVTFMRDIVESNHAVRPSGFQNIDLRPSLLYWFYLSIRPKPRSHRTNWIELQPRTYRYFDFYTTWKMEYEHTFSFSNWNWFLGNNYNRLDLSLASTTLSTHDRPFKRRRNEQWSKSYTQLWVDMFLFSTDGHIFILFCTRLMIRCDHRCINGGSLCSYAPVKKS